MPDAHNVVGVATRRHFNNSPGSFWPGCRRSATPTATPTSTPTRSEVEINYYVIEESNCDRQRCGKPLAMAANRFTSCLSETHTYIDPSFVWTACRPCIHQSHSLFDQLSSARSRLPPQLAICETRNALFMLLL